MAGTKDGVGGEGSGDGRIIAKGSSDGARQGDSLWRGNKMANALSTKSATVAFISYIKHCDTQHRCKKPCCKSVIAASSNICEEEDLFTQSSAFSEILRQ